MSLNDTQIQLLQNLYNDASLALRNCQFNGWFSEPK